MIDRGRPDHSCNWRFSSSISSASAVSVLTRFSIFRTACSTVVWSRPPKRRPISGSERSVSVLARYIATCLGRTTFAVLRDGSGVAQAVVVKTQVAPEIWGRFQELTLETSVRVAGEVRAEPRAPGGFDITVADLVIIGPSPIDYPIQPKEHGVDFLLDHRHLWLRSPKQRAIFVVRNEIEQAIHDFFYQRGFLRVDTPILTAAIGERLASPAHWDRCVASPLPSRTRLTTPNAASVVKP